MGRRSSRKARDRLRLDLSELNIHGTLLDDLRFYVGHPDDYIPKIFRLCVETLRKSKRMVLIESDNSEDLDDVWNEIFDSFSEKRYRQIVAKHNLSCRLDSYKDNVTDFLFQIFELCYTQIAKFLNNWLEDIDNPYCKDFYCKVSNVRYYTHNDGFGEVSIEDSVTIKVEILNSINTENLLAGTYEY